MFEIKKRDGLARVGELTTKHGKVKTPALLPVINPNMSQLFPEDMKEKFGAQMVITNAYIIKKNPPLREEALENGVHHLLRTNMPVMTDSGTFQTYIYDDVQINHKEIVEFQREIGADVGTMLDVFTPPNAPYTQAKNDIRENLERGEEALKVKGNMLLAGTVHGSTYPELREWAAEEVSKLNFDWYPIGGIVPLMEGYRYTTLAEIILSVKKKLNPSKPVHLFGGGHPMVFAFAALAGVDFFDSSSYIKYAKDDRLIFPDSSRKLNNIEELTCVCPVCSSYTVEELRALPKEERILKIAEHNLYIMFQEIRAVREAIAKEYLYELVEMKCRAHPSLVGVLEVFGKYKKEIEKSVSISRKTAFFDLSPFSFERPIIHRLRTRLRTRWYPFSPFFVELDDSRSTLRKPYSKSFAWFINKYLRHKVDDDASTLPILGLVKTKMGYLPLELSEIYPIAQSVMNSVEYPESAEFGKVAEEAFLKEKEISLVEIKDKEPKEIEAKLKRLWKKNFEENLDMSYIDFRDTITDFKSLRFKGSTTPFFDFLLLVSVLDYQFGAGSFEAIFLNRKAKDPLPPYIFDRFTTDEIEDAEIQFIKSKNTGKIRNVHGGGRHLLSMRAHDGFFLLKRVSAIRFCEHTGRYFVKVEKETAKFNRLGRSVFSKFVIEADEEIRPGDEVVVLDENGKLVALGSALLSVDEMKAFDVGMAVRVKEGMAKKKR